MMSNKNFNLLSICIQWDNVSNLPEVQDQKVVRSVLNQKEIKM